MKQKSARSMKTALTNVQVKGLSLIQLPHHSRLFLEYLRDPIAVKQYYPNAAISPLSVSDFASEVLAGYKTNRSELCSALIEINKQIGASTKVFDNIELLRDAETVAVVTGQQAGLFTGPLYTIYKALSAVKLAEELNKKGTKAIPVFWVASEDHDFDEVAQVFVTRKDGGLFQTQYRPADLIEGQSVGDVKIDVAIKAVIDNFVSHLPTTEFSARVRDHLDTSYSVGASFGTAFAKTITTLFADYGLVIIDPLNETIKLLASPIYRDAIEHADEIIAAIRANDETLEAHGFHSQVSVATDYFPLFWHDDDGRRRALRKVREGVYRTKGGNLEFTKAELKAIAVNEPRRLSPGVMMRSVVQDYLLPTLCYFGGAAEIAYFAQNIAVYKSLARPVTPILHRQSFTLVESRHRRVLEKFGWNLVDLLAGKEKVSLLAAEKVLSPNLAQLFTDVDKQINVALNRLEQQLLASDPTLAAGLEMRRRKINYHIATLRRKALASEVRKDETTRRQIDALFNALLPNGDLQERRTNIFYYINKYSFSFIELLYNCVDLKDKDHRIIYL